MEQFKIRNDGFKEIRKTLLIKTIPVSLLAISVGLAINYFNPNTQENTSSYAFVIPLAFGAVTFGLFRGIKRQKEIFDSYILTLDNDKITREQYNTPTVSILHSEIKEIVKNSNRSFTIKGNSALNIIDIPSQIEGYAKLEVSLAEIKQITTSAGKPFLQKIRGFISLATIGLMAVVYLSENKIIVGVSGVILLAIMGYSFFAIQISKNIDNKTKNTRWWLLLVSFSIIGIMYYKLTGQQ